MCKNVPVSVEIIIMSFTLSSVTHCNQLSVGFRLGSSVVVYGNVFFFFFWGGGGGGGLSNCYTMGCPPVRRDSPRALAGGLSSVQVDKHGITILYRLH